MARKVVKLEIGTVYQKTANGSYYFRYQVNGQRKAVSLKTKNQKDAVKKAQELCGSPQKLDYLHRCKRLLN